MGNDEQSAAAACFNIKVAPDVNPHETHHILSSTPGVISVTQTFPNEKDEELCRMFVIEVDKARCGDALKILQQNPAVEYAEQSAKRKAGK
jgi:hypothetical protein